MNYYGPHPSRSDEPDPVEVPELQAPTESVEKWVKDPEPVAKPRVRVRGILRTVGFGKPLPTTYHTILDEETAAELKSMKITEPVPPSPDVSKPKSASKTIAEKLQE